MSKMVLPRKGDLPSSHPGRITVGDMDGTVAAIGHGASVIYHQALSAADHARSLEDFAQEKLAAGVAGLADQLYQLANATPMGSGSPYKYLLPYEFADAWRFFGRQELVERLLEAITCRDSRCRLVILHGDAGMGKTSLLRAGLAPALLAAGHLPLQIRLTGEPLAHSIKRALVPGLSASPMLRDMSIPEFFRRTAQLLPEDRQIFVLIDQFEAFFNLPEDERQHFVEQLARCLFTDGARDHWLLSIRSARVGHLSTFEPTIPQPLASTVVLPPLSRREARRAILQPAALNALTMQPQLLDQILSDLGGDVIDPSRLQLICHTLAESLPPGEAQMTLAAYQALHGAERIFRDHLTLVLERNLPSHDRDAAWQLLAIIAQNGDSASPAHLSSHMDTYGVNARRTDQLLEILESNRLVRLSHDTYSLTSNSLLSPIRQWAEERAALEQARLEARRQWERMRSSALRGFLGGGLGATVAYFVAFTVQAVNLFLLPALAIMEFLPGAMAGIIFIFGIDIASVSLQGPRRRLRPLLGLLAGAFAFPPAFVFRVLLNFEYDFVLLLGAVEGAWWGAVVGLGTMLALNRQYPRWLTIPLSSLSGGIVLVALHLVFSTLFGSGGSYVRPRIPVNASSLTGLIFLAGTLQALIVIASALWGRAWGKRGLS